MLRARIIPCLLVHNGGLVKTTKFDDAKYVGDPLNAVRIFNEKEVDELLIVDIDATVKNVEPNYEFISQIAAECRMPLGYGGGIKTAEQVEKIVSLGVEKVAISSAAINDPALISESARRVGSQSVVAVMDVKKAGLFKKYELFIENGKRGVGKHPVDFAREMEAAGAGEIVINSIDNDGMMKGYDFSLITSVRESVNLPLTVLGGAGSLDDIGDLFEKFGVIGAAAGSIFVFKGKYRAVLIQYPNACEHERLQNRCRVS